MTAASAPLHQWVADRPGAEVRAALERLREAEDVVTIAVMPDVHLAREVCVGVALATASRLIPAAVGSDIGCGMAAIAFDGDADSCAAIVERGPQLLAALAKAVPIIRKAMEGLTDEDGWVSLGVIGQRLGNIAPDFDSRTYGSSKLSDAIRRTGAFELEMDDANHMRVRLKPAGGKSRAARPAETAETAEAPPADDAPKPKPKPRSRAKSKPRVKPAPAED